MTRKRCAIYTRKSTDEGLDQSFNSLDAQREASQAYIVSQKHEGWTVIKTTYDDGGYSGGSMERPALQKLLDDIRAGMIDIVVVYKIDRLTRSLADFAKMVEVFDAKGISFVSVTQQFNTTTSMGRLTLNVLLSFAQFEREVTAERIRDKIAASKRKGMWMGGSPPLGYDAQDKKLVINKEEALVVNQIFGAYLEHGSINALTSWARNTGIVTKIRHDADGNIRSGGKPFSRGNLHALLKNRTYIGEVSHKGASFPGEQGAIVSRELWDKVQEKLASTSHGRRMIFAGRNSFPLTGLLFDETGDRLTPVQATKKGRRYHYYVSTRLNAGSARDQSGWRLPARVLEQAVIAGFATFLRDERQVLQALLGSIASDCDPHILNQILKNARQLCDNLQKAPAGDQLRSVLPTIEKVVLGSDKMQIEFESKQLSVLVTGNASISISSVEDAKATHSILVPLAVKRRGVETRLVIGGEDKQPINYDPHLVRSIAKARAWFEALASGTVTSNKDIALAENIPVSEVSRQLPLAFLSPRIVAFILDGRQPVALTAKGLQRLSDLPFAWDRQAQILGF